MMKHIITIVILTKLTFIVKLQIHRNQNHTWPSCDIFTMDKSVCTLVSRVYARTSSRSLKETEQQTSSELYT